MAQNMFVVGLLAFAAGLSWGSGLASAEPLRDPVIASYDRNGVTEVELTAAQSHVLIGGQPFESLVFNGQYDSPLMRVRPGGVLRVKLHNRMTETTNLHFHGMEVSPLDDGDNIFHLVKPGESWQFNIKLPSYHHTGMYWYHSHFNHGAQRQVSAGIAGAILVDGLLDHFPELKKAKERFLVLRNFQRTLDGKLASDITPGAPSIRTINGQLNPTINIRPGETQVWHFANIAANQYFHLTLEGLEFSILGRDGNVATRENVVKDLFIAPSARLSAAITGPAKGSYELMLNRVNTGPDGDYYPAQLLGTVVSSGARARPVRISSPYPRQKDLRTVSVDQKRVFAFQDADFEGYINGAKFDIARVNTTVKLGDTEEWLLTNPTATLHQFHIHQTDFQVVAINGKAQEFTGYRDNIYIPPNGTTTIRIPFTNPLILGKFVYHCHIMQHEDGGMMAVIQVVKPEDYEKAVKLEPVGGIYGDNEICTYLKNTGKKG